MVAPMKDSILQRQLTKDTEEEYRPQKPENWETHPMYSVECNQGEACDMMLVAAILDYHAGKEKEETI